MTDIRFRLQIAGGNMRMIKRDVFEYFKKEPDVMQVKDVVRLLHCSKNTVYKLIQEWLGHSVTKADTGAAMSKALG